MNKKKLPEKGTVGLISIVDSTRNDSCEVMVIDSVMALHCKTYSTKRNV